MIIRTLETIKKTLNQPSSSVDEAGTKFITERISELYIKKELENILQSRIPSSEVQIHFIFGNVFINWNKIYNNINIFSCASCAIK